jgi:hypothetical protein
MNETSLSKGGTVRSTWNLEVAGGRRVAAGSYLIRFLSDVSAWEDGRARERTEWVVERWNDGATVQVGGLES